MITASDVLRWVGITGLVPAVLVVLAVGFMFLIGAKPVVKTR